MLKLHIQDLISNFEEFVQAIQREKKPIPDKADLPGTDYDNKKVLGTISYIKEDPLGFRVDHLADEDYTYVSITRKVAGVFDPL